EQPPRTRSLWAPLMALGVGAVAAVIAFSAAAPEVAGDGLATVPTELAPTGEEPTMTAAAARPTVPSPAASPHAPHGAAHRGAPGVASAPPPGTEAAGGAASTPAATAPGA